MKISLQWLNEWLEKPLSADQAAEQLTQLGLEVDGTEPAAGEFTGVVVAEITACEKHPDADKLKVCQVNNGQETLQIVCGAPNARVGLKTALSQVGAVLPGDFKIKASKLRGVESNGMLCSEVELGISQESDGIIELAKDATVGQDVKDHLALNDVIIEVDLTPNRADCFSVRGAARDLAVLNEMTLHEPASTPVPASIDDTVGVQMNAPAQCARYISRVIKGIDNTAQTPTWMKEKLRRAGVKSIHPVVDVTNYVMMEMGQPMHAFDLDHLSGDLVVRMAKDQETMVLLDESEVTLDESFLLIADQDKPLAVAGVMGGLDSGVKSDTKDIMLESAFFDPATIMGKSRKLGVHTESALRFERGVDPALQQSAMERATTLIIELCGGQAGPVHAEQAAEHLPKQSEITLTVNKLRRVLGFYVAADRVTQIFKGLGFETEFANDQWHVKAPTWRFDMDIAEDLIEEVVRVVGYDAMPATRLMADDAVRVIPEQIRSENSIKMHLANLGYQEVINYAFVPEKQLVQLGQSAGAFALANPLTQDMAVMRTHLLGGLLQNIKANVARKYNDLSLFEMGKVFSNDGEIEQTDALVMVKTGMNEPEQWGTATRKVDFYDIKGHVGELLGEDLTFTTSQLDYMHPGRQAQISRNGTVLGHLGQVHPSLCQKMKIKQDIYMAEFTVDAIKSLSLPHWQPVSKFPAVRRDLSLLVSEEVTWNDINGAVSEALAGQSEVLQSVRLFDVYQGEHVESGFKSVAMALIFQEKNRTLEDKEVDNLVEKAVSYLSDKFKAELRA